MAKHIGQIGPYERGTDFSGYLERFNYFIEANDIQEEKRKAVFLSVVGETTFQLAKDLLQPAKIETKSYDEVVSALKMHLEPQSSVIVQRYKFDKLTKGSQQPVSDFINEIRHLSEKCRFGTSLDERLRDKLVSGLCDDKLVTRLLSEGDSLTFTKACEICLHLDQNRKDTQNLLKGEPINKINSKNKATKGYKAPSGQEKSPCYRCNGFGHRQEDCYFRTKTCNAYCHKQGHKALACRSKTKFHKNDVKQISTDSTCDNEYYIMSVSTKSSMNGPILVDVTLNGKKVPMEVDTGASRTLLTETTWHQINRGQLTLNGQCPKLLDYSGNAIPVLGCVDIPVTLDNQSSAICNRCYERKRESHR